jgi:hypothetical protein
MCETAQLSPLFGYSKRTFSSFKGAQIMDCGKWLENEKNPFSTPFGLGGEKELVRVEGEFLFNGSL